MILLTLSYLAGALTILSPCILPVLPFVLSRATEPFWRGTLPMLISMAAAFAAVASLAAVAGGWAIEANRYGRDAALLLMGAFGLSLLFPTVATRLSRPLLGAGGRLSTWAQGRHFPVLSSITLGLATGLLWVPCAGPVLGLVLSGAALNGPSPETTLILLAYGMGAATSLAAGLLAGRQLISALRPSLRWIDGARRLAGIAVVAGVTAIGLGFDAGLLTRLSAVRTNAWETTLLSLSDHHSTSTGIAAQAANRDKLSGPLAALSNQSNWINTPPLRSSDLQGRVVVVNFWTYSCINCLRALPHVRRWADRYQDKGLVVVGVHAPEFAFEKDVANVTKAASSLGVRYPVVLDNEFSIWRAFRNAGWPGLFLLSADGKIQHQVFGEGGFDEAEHLIRRLLAKSADTRDGHAVEPVDMNGAQMEADWANLASPETYIGYALAARFNSLDPLVKDAPGEYHHRPKLKLNEWSLSGNWTVGAESGTLNAAGGGLRYRFHARDLHLVLRPRSPDQPVRFRVTVDGVRPGPSHGSDVDDQGFGVVREDRLYQLVRQTGPISDRTFEIEFCDPGVLAYAFTFG